MQPIKKIKNVIATAYLWSIPITLSYMIIITLSFKYLSHVTACFTSFILIVILIVMELLYYWNYLKSS
jgi:hypothetical protein